MGKFYNMEKKEKDCNVDDGSCDVGATIRTSII